MGNKVEDCLLKLEERGKTEEWSGDDEMYWLIEKVRTYRNRAIEAIARGIPADWVDWETDLTEEGRQRYLAQAQKILEEDE